MVSLSPISKQLLHVQPLYNCHQQAINLQYESKYISPPKGHEKLEKSKSGGISCQRPFLTYIKSQPNMTHLRRCLAEHSAPNLSVRRGLVVRLVRWKIKSWLHTACFDPHQGRSKTKQTSPRLDDLRYLYSWVKQDLVGRLVPHPGEPSGPRQSLESGTIRRKIDETIR